MPDFPGSPQFSPNFLSTLSGNFAISTSGGISSVSQATWVVNLAVYIPFVLPAPFLVKRFFTINGSSAATPNFDVGVFASSGEKLVSTGSFTKVGITAGGQYKAPAADYLLAPGRYYMGFACDSALANSILAGSLGSVAEKFAAAGVLEQSTAFPLPALMAPSGRTTHSLYAIVGITST